MTTVNIESIKGKLKALSKEKSIELQNLFNKLGEERFLARLSKSQWSKNLIFKGGSLIPHLVYTSRRTRDIDFSVRNTARGLNNLLKIVQDVASIDLEDGFTFGKPHGETMEHVRMPYPGARIKIIFHLGTMRGVIWMDLAFGDEVKPVKQTLTMMRFHGKLLLGKDVSLLVYPPEYIFSEKLQTAVFLGAGMSRMKDYYDLLRLITPEVLNKRKLKSALTKTFASRNTLIPDNLSFDKNDLTMLNNAWKLFLKKWQLGGVPQDFKSVLSKINRFLTHLKK